MLVSKVRSGGILAGHDYYVKEHNSNFAPGVKRAVNESFNVNEIFAEQDCWVYSVP